MHQRTWKALIAGGAALTVGLTLTAFGAPSHAAAAMEMGAAAVLVNTAIAVSPNPVEMGRAFKLAVEAGRMAFEAKLAKQYRHAQASSPLTAFLD